MGVRITGQDYKVKPYSRKLADGTPIPPEEIAEESAKYLAAKQWKNSEPNEALEIGTEKINTEELKFNTEAPNISEIKEAIRKFKKQQVTGPR